ncbi:hypothetical protein ACLB2K_042560 [Fragaria x ananassa]
MALNTLLQILWLPFLLHLPLLLLLNKNKKPQKHYPPSPPDFNGQHSEFLPFGAGRRVCPGIYMATTTVELGLSNLLYSFDWKLPEGMKEEDINIEETTGELALTISKKTALNLVPVKFSG